jgi:glycyl-tRNA synthetase beta chain
MNEASDFLIEIGTEELPAKGLKKLAQAFSEKIEEQLATSQIPYENIQYFATPRRLAVLVKQLAQQPKVQWIERRGPSMEAAFNNSSEPTPAALGFAKSCGVSVKDLKEKPIGKSTYLVFQQESKVEKTIELLPDLLKKALDNLPLNRPMRWRASVNPFLRPIRWVTILYGDQTVSMELFGLQSSNKTQGHRFHAPQSIRLSKASEYEKTLETKAFVIPNFEKRKNLIQEKIQAISKNVGIPKIEEALLDEVTGLVEWPIVLLGQFSEKFLSVPDEALMLAMTNHQKYFPILDDCGKLQPFFIVVSNIDGQDHQNIILGNERVLTARLSDAHFFYEQDSKVLFLDKLPKLEKIVFQKQLGTLSNKVKRMEILGEWIAEKTQIKKEDVVTATQLCKLDLTTEMVEEFPELQGIMGYYYARQSTYSNIVAEAIREHYQPKFSGDRIPESPVGCALALSDKIDTIVGIFSIGQAPTGEKDPFGLRRAALGVLRILIEKPLSLDLKEILQESMHTYGEAIKTEGFLDKIFTFMMDRLRAWYLEKEITPQVFNAVLNKHPLVTQPYDFDQRIHAVQHFQTLSESKSLAEMNKRIANLLKKQAFNSKQNWEPELLQEAAEKSLAKALSEKEKQLELLEIKKDYVRILTSLIDLESALSRFFDEVMVMVEDASIRQNRLALLSQLHQMFLKVADISKLQSG